MDPICEYVQSSKITNSISCADLILGQAIKKALRMNNFATPLRDIEFALFDVFDFPAHSLSLALTPLDRDLIHAILSEAARFADQELAPINQMGDSQGCQLIDGKVITPEGFKDAYRLYCDGGWPSISRAIEYGGQGLPQSLGIVINEIMGTGCWSWGMYTGLSQGAMHTIETHGTDAQKQLFLPHLISGRWTGTMCLTESQAGSDLGLLKTSAQPQADGSYAIKGTKIFISAGDHDLSDNIVHIVLARIEGAPSGVKGLSLFIVPKLLPSDSEIASTWAERNHIKCSRLEEKMGIHGNSTCELIFEGAKGWLLGEANKGINHMFTFMNLARIGAGVQGIAHAELGYQQAREYAQSRLQMRALSGVKNPTGPADPIVVHPDVKRMLLTQKVIAEGLRMMIYDAALKMDTSLWAKAAEQRQHADNLLGLMTPIVKAFSTELGFESANLALQCFGGHGYIREWGVEQNLRDCRIASLYEGTTGIQALDLLGRKVLGTKGHLVELLQADIAAFCKLNDVNPAMSSYLQPLQATLAEWIELSRFIAQRAHRDPEELGAAAVDYLMYSGYLLMAYCWARAALAAQMAIAKGGDDAAFYHSKLKFADVYFARLLPRALAHAAAIRSGAGNLMSVSIDEF